MSKGATYYTLLAALRQRELLDDAVHVRVARTPARRRRHRERTFSFQRLRRLVSR
jgi:hypothetical protein